MSDSQDGTNEDKSAKPVVQGIPSPTRFPFDQVVVADDGAQKNLSPDEFFALPLAQRIQYVVQQKASFFAAGQKVDSKEVLGQMRKLRTQLH